MSRRRIARRSPPPPLSRFVSRLLVGALLLVAGCRPFGAGAPICGELGVSESGGDVRVTITSPSGEVHRLRSSHVIQLQAVPEAELGVCVADLPRGWDLIQPEPRSGEVPLQFFSTGLGGLFLRVTLVDACEPPPAAYRADASDDQAERWVEIRDRSRGMAVTVVPVSARHEQQAYELATDLQDRELRGSRLRVALTNVVHGAAEERIQTALEEGAAVIVVDDDFTLRDELELRLPDVQRPITASFGAILTELADRTEPPRYDATWWELAPGGCTIFEFDASGPDAATLEDDVDAAIGRFPLGDLRRALVEHGALIEDGAEVGDLSQVGDRASLGHGR